MKHILSSLLPYTSVLASLARLAEPSEAKPGLLPSFWNRLTDYLSVLKYCHIGLVVASGGEIPPMLKTLDLAAAAAAAAAAIAPRLVSLIHRLPPALVSRPTRCLRYV